MCFVRKAMDWVFSQEELRWLDDIMPEMHHRDKEDEAKKQEEVHLDFFFFYNKLIVIDKLRIFPIFYDFIFIYLKACLIFNCHFKLASVFLKII